MKTHRNRFGFKIGSPRKASRSRSALSKRFSLVGLEPLEVRTLLTASALTGLSAWQTSDTGAFSMRCLLASNAGTQHDTTSQSQSSSGSNTTTPTSNLVVATPMTHVDDTSSANVEDTSPVTNSVVDTTEPIVTPLVDSPLMEYRLEAQDMSGNPITSINAGQDFQLVTFVHDLRTPVPSFAGVFAGYTNVSYDSSLVSTTTSSLTFGSFYTLTPSGNLSVPGTITGGGAAATSASPPGAAEKELWRTTFHANSVGTFSFNSSFDATAGHETLLYGNDNNITADQIQFGSFQLTVNGQPTVSITNATQNEGTPPQGQTGVTNFLFTVSLSSASSTPVTVAIATADGTALGNSPAPSNTKEIDYNSASGTITFAAGETSRVVTVVVKQDAVVEPDETFNVVLSSPTGATLGANSTGIGTILNDDQYHFAISDVSQNEGDSQNSMVFTVTLANEQLQPVAVQFNTVNGTATGSSDSSGDYVSTSGTITFAPGETSKTITVTINGDTVKEPNETFTVALTGPANTVFDGTNNGIATGTILNDDGPHITFVDKQVSVTEGNSGTTPVLFTVNIGTADTSPVTVAYHTQDGTANAGSDYTAVSGTLTFNPGDPLTQVVTVLVNGDLLNEADETFTLELSSPSDATLVDSSATATITNDDAPPALSFESSSVSHLEGNSGTTQYLFTVNLSAASGQPVTVQYQTANGTALTQDNDYQGTSGTLTFAAGTTSQVITVLVNGDTKSEANETFSLNLFNSTNASNAITVDTQISATGTITDDDVAPTISIVDISGNEGNSGTTPLIFSVSLSAASGQPVTVVYSTSDGTATTADNDYVPTSGTITFAVGETSKLIQVFANGDTKNEADETFNVNLSSPTHATIAKTTGVATILNDDAKPTLSIVSSSPKAEGNSGTTDFLFTVKLSSASSQVITVAYTTVDGTATTTNNDYVGQVGTLTFAAGETSKIITVAVNGDTLNEADETFSVTLSGATNSTISLPTASGLILNDDAAPALTITNVTHNEGDSGLTNFVFQVTLSPAGGQTATVVYNTADGTAVLANNDYKATNGTLTFAPGVTTQNITVQVVGDLFAESDETFLVKLSNPKNATLATSQGVGTIHSESTDTVVVAPSSLKGMAFVDSNTNTSLDGVERALAGVVVTITGVSSSTGLAVSQHVSTAHDGSYTFTNLDPGTYTVSFSQPTQYLAGKVNIGSQGGQAFTNAGGAGYSVTIPLNGGVNGVNNNFTVAGKQSQYLSMRDFMASNQGTGQFYDVSGDAPASASSQAASTLATANSASGLVTQLGNTVTFNGTAGNDTFVFTAGAKNTVVINGVTYSFDPSQVKNILFNGSGGTDSVTLNGSSDTDFANVGVGSGTFVGAGFNVAVSHASALTVKGAGNLDTAVVHDSVLADQATGTGSQFSITNSSGAVTTLLAFSRVHAVTSAGGNDTIHKTAIDYVLEQEGNWTAA